MCLKERKNFSRKAELQEKGGNTWMDLELLDGKHIRGARSALHNAPCCSGPMLLSASHGLWGKVHRFRARSGNDRAVEIGGAEPWM